VYKSLVRKPEVRRPLGDLVLDGLCMWRVRVRKVGVKFLGGVTGGKATTVET